MRLFIAINFDKNTRARLLALRDELRSNSERGSFVLPENLHLTLVFLGECDAKQVAAVQAAMDTVDFGAFDMFIERLGRFKRDGGEIWWAGVRENRALQDLQRCLSKTLIEEGFPIDTRKYSPHITLGRKVVTGMAPGQIEPFGQKVSGIDLMKSERINGVLTYTSIYHRG